MGILLKKGKTEKKEMETTFLSKSLSDTEQDNGFYNRRWCESREGHSSSEDCTRTGTGSLARRDRDC